MVMKCKHVYIFVTGWTVPLFSRHLWLASKDDCAALKGHERIKYETEEPKVRMRRRCDADVVQAAEQTSPQCQ